MSTIEELKKRISELEKSIEGLNSKFEKVVFAYEKQMHGFPYIGDAVYVPKCGSFGLGEYGFHVSYIPELTKQEFESIEFNALLKKGLAFDTREKAEKYCKDMNKKLFPK